ncbi:MAG: polysaccharide deacetylase family protein [Acetobacteraceae bacterium]|nr:polysaccharide deacetylase family protein [Acetobacteraceae bacterium]
MSVCASWPDGSKLAVSFVVNVEEGAELSPADGDRAAEPVDELGMALKPGFRNFGNESNYRYGIEAGAPRVLRLLEEFGVRATFTAAALALERAPALAARLAASPHEVAAHGWRWVPQHRLDAEEERAFIRRARDSIARSVGRPPVGWLSRYLHTAETRRLLAEEGFLYHMDDYGADWPSWDAQVAPPIVVLPYALDTNDMKLWQAPALTPAQWADYAIESYEWMKHEQPERAQILSIGVHLRIIGRPGRIGALARVIKHIRAGGGAWIATRQEIAAHFARCVPPPPPGRAAAGNGAPSS